MQREVQDIAQIDRVIHEPARLAIVAVLSACESADFKSILHLTGLTKGNLSSQLQKLEEAGYITITKSFQERYPLTTCALTSTGREAFKAYWQRYKALGSKLQLDADEM
ncbi:MAG: transcriptional regulator [Anaerolineae bacterium]